MNELIGQTVLGLGMSNSLQVLLTMWGNLFVCGNTSTDVLPRPCHAVRKLLPPGGWIMCLPAIVVSALLSVSSGIFAQGKELRFEHLTVEQGLSDNGVYCIHQDSKGFLWAGTANGLNRYDGYGFTVFRYNPLDSQSISINNVPNLYEDLSGAIWVRGPEGGSLNRFDKTTEKFTKCLPGFKLSSIYEEPDGALWFASRGGGLFRYDRGSASFIRYQLGTDTIYSVCRDPDGQDRTIFVGTPHGLVRFDKSHGAFSVIETGPDVAVKQLCVDKEGNVWMRATGGLHEYERGTGKFLYFPFIWKNGESSNVEMDHLMVDDGENSFWIATISGLYRFERSSRKYRVYHDDRLSTRRTEEAVDAIFKDRSGTLWIGIRGGGLGRFERTRDRFTFYVHDPRDAESLSENSVNAIDEDESGALWVGTVAGGLNKLDGAKKAFHHYAGDPSSVSSLSAGVVNGLVEDKNGGLWIATSHGVSRFDRVTGTYTQFLHDPKNPRSLAFDISCPILEDREGTIWVGTFGGGLDRLDRQRHMFAHYTHAAEDTHSLGDNSIASLCEGRDGTLWVGTAHGGLDRFDRHSGHFIHFEHDPGDPCSLSSNWVYVIYEDRRGTVWVGTGGGGLDKLDKRTLKFTHYRRVPEDTVSLSYNSVHAIYEDRKGTLWVGTGAGLNRFESSTGSFKRYTTRNGIESDEIAGILEDDRGYLWLGTGKGVSRFDPETGKFRNFDSGDGVLIHQSRVQSCYRNRSGEMYFGGVNGFVRFHPDSIKDNPYVPPIVITAFKMFDKPVALDSAISEKHSVEMTYKENVFSFEFAALNYTSSEKNQYAYKLEGFDNDWTYCRTRRYATYTNLDGGSYVFRVKGSNNDGVWNEAGTSIAVIITPPFWKTWWFSIGLFVVVLLSVGGAIRYVEMQKLRRKIDRLERAQAIERERLRISQDMHDEVGSTLTEISILSELAKKNTPEGGVVADQVRKISDRSRQVIDDVSDIVWALNPKNDNLESLVSHLRHFAVQYCSMTSIRCQCDIPDSFPEVFVSSDSRRAMFLIVKEALHNAVKHSCATEVVVKIDATGETAEIQVGDNGKGFNPALPSTRGNGLTNMKSRAESLGGTLAIESPGRGGTMIRLRFPLAALRKE